MKINQIQTTLLYFLVSLAALFLVLWIVDYSPFGLPETIPKTGLRIYGILILALLAGINFFYQRQLVKQNPEISILHLILFSLLVFFASLLVYQLLRQMVILDRPFSSAVLISSFFPALLITLIAASTSLALKKANGLVRRIPLILIVIIVIIARKYISTFEW